MSGLITLEKSVGALKTNGKKKLGNPQFNAHHALPTGDRSAFGRVVTPS